MLRENIYTRDMILVHEALSECALQMYEVSLKYLERLRVIKFKSRHEIAF